MSLIDVVILVILGVGVGFALRAIRKGKGGCNGHCEGCQKCCGQTKKDEK